MTKKIGVSIILPTYNDANGVKKCISLILKSDGINKKFKPEIIIIDDTANNSIRNLAHFFSKQIDIKYIKPKKRAGIAEARNIGVKNASYDLIINIDADIEVTKKTILSTINALKKHKAAAMVSGNVYWKERNKVCEIDRPRKHDRRIKVGKTNYIEMLHGRYSAFYKKAFLNVGGYDSKLFPMQGEGVDLSIKFWRNGYPLVHSNAIKVYHIRESKVKKGSFFYHGWNKERTAKMFYSIFTLIYKYDALDINTKSSNWAKTINLESKRNFGSSAEFVIISSFARVLDKISKNYKLIEKSRKNIPNLYDFKPYDVFSEKKLFNNCIKKAEKRLRGFYKKIYK